MFALEHSTRYRFDRAVSVGPHLIRLRPAPHCLTPIRAYSLQVEPGGHSIDWQEDSFCNRLARLVFPRPITGFAVNVELKLEMAAVDPSGCSAEHAALCYPFEYDPRLRAGLVPYLQIAESGPLLIKWLEKLNREHRPIADFLGDVNGCVQNSVDYCVRMQPGVQSCEQTLRLRSGSCRDSAWLLVQVLRHLGLAARFVSGYLLQPDSDVPDALYCVELHAWAEVYILGPGWIGLDSTSGLFAGAGHIPLACTPEPLAAMPVSGTIGKCKVTLEFYSTVRRINE